MNVSLSHICPTSLYPRRTELKEPVGQIVCTDKGILAVEQNKVLVPPAWSKTFAWGYADLSCRLANYESDKVSGRGFWERQTLCVADLRSLHMRRLDVARHDY